MLAASLAGVLVVYAIGVDRAWRAAGTGRGIRWIEVGAFVGGWLAVVTALSPALHARSDRSLTAHMVQHELLMVVAAPLLAAGAPLLGLLWALPARARHRVVDAVRLRPLTTLVAAITAPLAVFVLHASALWAWHVPALYDRAIRHDGVHAVEHVCFLGTAALFWWGIVHGRYGRLGYGAAVLYVFATAMHGGLLGALLAFSPRVWYASYAALGGPGLSPLEDQELAGFVMWIPAGLLCTAGALVLFAMWLRESERRI